MTITQDDLVRYVNNPGRGINEVVNEIETNFFERRVKINSKSHPFILATDLILGSSHAVLNRVSDSISKLFPAHARSISDLSRHMSEEERVGMFGTPSSMVVEYAITEDMFMAIAKDYTSTSGKSTFTYKLLVLPKDTEITFNGYTFALENGIEIRYSEKTGYQVVYDETTNSPFNPISNNLLKKERRPGAERWWLVVTIPVRQLACKAVENITSNQSSGCRGTVPYQDYLYAVRAFLTRNGTKTEIPVIYDQDVFAPLMPTLSINLDTSNNTFDYEIPDVYIANELGIGTVSIYVWTTKGELIGKDFSKVDTGSIGINYQDYRYGAGTLGLYSGALKTAGGMVWRSTTITSGGSNAMPFEQIKRSFILGRRQRNLPITENNLSGLVEEYGYSSVKAIDFVTKRSYSLTKELPIPDNKKFYAPMSCFVGSYRASANDLVRSGVVLDNGSRITIPHNVLFDVSQPTTNLVYQSVKEGYEALSYEELVDLSNDKTLVYTPFYYVLDTSNKQASLRTYHLDLPVFNHQAFQDQNKALGLEVGVGSISIAHNEQGYLITVVTQSGESYKQLDNESLGVQLSMTPMDSNTLANMKATLYGVTEDGERIWQFQLDTRFDVDVNDVIYFNNFSQFGDVQANLGTNLTFDATLLFTVEGDPESTKSDMDAKVDQTLFPNPMVAIIETTYNTTLGVKLGNLYSRIRPLIGEAQYKRYPNDVPETYTETTYVRDEDSQYVFDAEGLRIIEHRAGEVVYNPGGGVRLRYRANDVMYDENNKPIELAPRDLQYHWDFVAFDGNYYFSKDVYDVDFAQATKVFFVNVVGKDMDFFVSSAIDQTDMVYQPRNKLGYQKVVINSNAQTYLKQDLSLVVTYYLSKIGYKNQNLKEALQKSTPRIINEWLYNSTTTANSDLIALLKAAGAADVKAVRVDAYAGNTIIDIISNVDSLTGFSVRKHLQLTGDGLLSIKEDIDVTFQPHDIAMVDTGSA